MLIPLTQGKFAIIDDEDYDKVKDKKWQYTDTGYASSGQKSILMHRVILGLRKGDGTITDHINGNGLDNRKSNLRVCNKSQNTANSKIPNTNTSGYKGVYLDRKRSKWVAEIRCNGKRHHLGRYCHALDAAYAYDNAAREFFGEFARTNF